MNMVKLFEDLRFFIGAFFVIIGILLLLQGWLEPVLIAGLNPNLISGAIFLAFGCGALLLSCLTYRAWSKTQP